MHHTQCSMQYVPSIIPATTGSPNLTPPPLQNPQIVFPEPTHSLSWFVSPPISPNFLLLPISPCPLCYSLCSTNKRNHMIIDSLCLTYFTQHNIFQSHPCWYKNWVFILSDGCVIIKSRAEINELETRDTVELNNETRSWFFERINKVKKTIGQTNPKEKREDPN